MVKISYPENQILSNNLRTDLAKEDPGEDWARTECKFIILFTQKLNLLASAIEIAHCMGRPNASKLRTVLIKFASFEEQGTILSLRHVNHVSIL